MSLKLEDIRVPDHVGSESTVSGDLIIFVSVDQDELAENPCDQDGVGKIHSFSKRHGNYLCDFEFPSSEDECREELIKKYKGDVVFLGYYEHGQCSWFVEGRGGPGTDCRWDGVQFAGIWVPDKYLLKEARYTFKLKRGTPERDAQMTEWAAQACTIYTCWCNGDMYCYAIKVYKVRRADNGTVFDTIDDYRYNVDIVNDSCCGYDGSDIKNGVTEGLETVMELLKMKGLT